VVTLRDIQGPDDATTVANRIINALRQPMRLSTHEILVTRASALRSTRPTQRTWTRCCGMRILRCILPNVRAPVGSRFTRRP